MSTREEGAGKKSKRKDEIKEILTTNREKRKQF
jgi:hypothetical protein